MQGDRVFGNPLLGTWTSESGEEFYPNYIHNHQDEFDWRLEDRGFGGSWQYPYTKQGEKLEYDEAE